MEPTIRVMPAVTHTIQFKVKVLTVQLIDSTVELWGNNVLFDKIQNVYEALDAHMRISRLTLNGGDKFVISSRNM